MSAIAQIRIRDIMPCIAVNISSNSRNTSTRSHNNNHCNNKHADADAFPLVCRRDAHVVCVDFLWFQHSSRGMSLHKLSLPGKRNGVYIQIYCRLGGPPHHVVGTFRDNGENIMRALLHSEGHLD